MGGGKRKEGEMAIQELLGIQKKSNKERNKNGEKKKDNRGVDGI